MPKRCSNPKCPTNRKKVAVHESQKTRTKESKKCFGQPLPRATSSECCCLEKVKSSRNSKCSSKHPKAKSKKPQTSPCYSEELTVCCSTWKDPGPRSTNPKNSKKNKSSTSKHSSHVGSSITCVCTPQKPQRKQCLAKPKQESSEPCGSSKSAKETMCCCESIKKDKCCCCKLPKEKSVKLSKPSKPLKEKDNICCSCGNSNNKPFKEKATSKPEESKGILSIFRTCLKKSNSKNSNAPCGRYHCKYNSCRINSDKSMPRVQCTHPCEVTSKRSSCACFDKKERMKLRTESICRTSSDNYKDTCEDCSQKSTTKNRNKEIRKKCNCNVSCSYSQMNQETCCYSIGTVAQELDDATRRYEKNSSSKNIVARGLNNAKKEFKRISTYANPQTSVERHEKSKKCELCEPPKEMPCCSCKSSMKRNCSRMPLEQRCHFKAAKQKEREVQMKYKEPKRCLKSSNKMLRDKPCKRLSFKSCEDLKKHEEQHYSNERKETVLDLIFDVIFWPYVFWPCRDPCR